MKKLLNIALVALAAATSLTPAFAEQTYILPQEVVGRAFTEHFRNIDHEIYAFIAAKGIDPTLRDYCDSKMYAEEDQHPADGSIPFGVNFYKVKTVKELYLILTV